MPRLRSLACLVLLVACGGGGGSSDGSTGASSTSSATDPASTTVTGGGTTGTTGGEPMTTGATGTSPTTGPARLDHGTPGTSVGESSTGAPGTSDASTGDASTGGTTGGPVGACKEASGDYGPCDALIGYAFVDGGCQLVSGCNCEPDCELFFDDPVACASTCAAAGECQLDNIQGGGVAPDRVGPGSFCDEVDACVELPELAEQLKELFPELVCEQGQPCGGQNCHLLWQGQLTDEQWTQICAASLLPGVDELYCMVFGP